MDAFDFVDFEEEEDKKERKENKRAKLRKSIPKGKVNFSTLIWNIGTFYFAVSTICLVGFFIAIFTSPYS